jgi:signal transduction histidine kinase
MPQMEAIMETYFATPERVSNGELETEIDIVSKNPVMSGLLNSVSGLLAVLDEQRQIVALNDSFLKVIGIDNPEEVLGLRHGQVLHCIHAEEDPAGCGTTKFCSSCGAAIAIVSSLEENQAIERICALSTKRGDKEVDIVLHVKSHPIRIAKKIFILIFLQDITRQQQMAALERTFFHDINNMLSMLLMATELLIDKSPSELANTIHQASIRLHKEISIQRLLSQNETRSYQPMRRAITIKKIFSDLRSFFANHPVALNKNIEYQQNYSDIVINTDFSLLLRVLGNMTINALEATEEKGNVKIWTEHEEDFLTFCVWNAQEISKEIIHRIFQRNFSTKEQDGRGIGTFSMKLFGEKILGGQVGFTTSQQEGTIFRFSHPI